MEANEVKPNAGRYLVVYTHSGSITSHHSETRLAGCTAIACTGLVVVVGLLLDHTVTGFAFMLSLRLPCAALAAYPANACLPTHLQRGSAD